MVSNSLLLSIYDSLAANPVATLFQINRNLSKTLIIREPLSHVIPPSRLHILGITQGICFLRDPNPHSLWMASYSEYFRRADAGLPRSVCSFYVTLGWCFTPGSFWVNATHKSRVPPETISLLGLP